MKKFFASSLSSISQKFLWHSGLGNIHDVLVLGLWRELAEKSRNPLLLPVKSFFSQSDEDGIIQRIFERIGLEKGKYVELGVGDGLENNTLFLHLKGWDGLWFGGQKLNVPKNFQLKSNLEFNRLWIDMTSLQEVVIPKIHAFGEIDLLSLDLDGNDFYFAKQILESGIRPKVWVQEYNGNLSSDILWIQEYNPNHRWNVDSYFGASLMAYNDLFSSFGYKLVACNLLGINAFFVRKDFVDQFKDIPQELDDLFSPALPLFQKMKQAPSPLLYQRKK